MTALPKQGREGLGLNYYKLLVASTVSNLGDGVSAIAYPWLASAVTRSPLHIAGIGVAARLPWLIFSLPAGALTDRLNRRNTIAAMDAVRFLITLVVAFAVLLSLDTLPTNEQIKAGTVGGSTALLAVLYVAGFLAGFAEVLRDNTAQTIMPAVVATDQLEVANGRLFGAEIITNQFAGPPLGGLLLAVGLAVPFFLDAGSFAVAAFLIYAMRGDFRPKPPAPAGPRSIRAEIGEGFRWLWRNTLLRDLAVILGVQNFLFTMALATFVLYAQEVLELGPAAFGVLLTAGAIGSVVGSVSTARVTKALGTGPALNATLGNSALALGLIGIVANVWVVGVMFAATGFLTVVWNVITVSLRQTIIPDHLLGRVNSVYRFFGWGMIPLGGLAGGALVALGELLGSRSTALRLPFLVTGAVYLGLFVIGLRRLNSARIDEAKLAAESRSVDNV